MGGRCRWPSGLAVCPDGTSFVSGRLVDSAVFAAGTSNETTITGHAFVASYAPDGALRWVIPLKGKYTNSKVEPEVHALPDCSPLLVGRYGGISNDTEDELTIGDATTPALSGILPQSGSLSYVHFVAQLDAQGQLLAAAPIVAPYRLSAYRDGTLLLATDTTLSSVALDGSVLWQKPINVVSDSFLVLDVALGASGIALGGGWDNFPEPIVFDPGGPNEATLDGDFKSNDEIFVAAYDDTGTFLWADVETSQYSDRVTSVTAFPDGSIGSVGQYSDGAAEVARRAYKSQGFRRTFSKSRADPVVGVGEHMVVNLSSEDGTELIDDLGPYETGIAAGPAVALIDFDAGGDPHWVLPLPQVDVWLLRADASGAVYAFGRFATDVTFETQPTPTALTGAGESQLFLAKLTEIAP